MNEGSNGLHSDEQKDVQWSKHFLIAKICITNEYFPKIGFLDTLWGGVWGVLPTLAGKWGGVGGVFFGKIRHNKQTMSINLTFFPFSFDQMFTNSSF